MSRSLIDSAEAFRADLAAFDPATLSGADCARLAESLSRTANACAAVRVAVSHRAVHCGAHQTAGFKDGASWLAHQTGTTTGQARRELEAAERLPDCPETQAAFFAGHISTAQAVEITQAETETPGVEHSLVAVARSGDLSKLKDEAREQRQARTPVEDLAEEQRKAREFKPWRDRLGMVRFQGGLTPEVGLPFLQRLEKEALKLRHAARTDHPERPPERFSAYAADAFAELVSSSGGERRPTSVELVLLCDLRAFVRGYAEPGEMCKILDGGPITVEHARDLSENAFFKAAVYDGVDIQKIKHFGRYLSAELRTALMIGKPPDFKGRLCVDCGSRFRLQTDHVDPVANDGPTSYENLAPRCYACHSAKTERDRKAGLLGPHARPRKQQPRAGPFDDP